MTLAKKQQREITTYNITCDVRRRIEGDPNGEELCFQHVFPTVNGIAHPEDASYRFIRYSTLEKRLKSQMGQAQVPDFTDMLELIIEMAEKRKQKIPAALVHRIQKLSQDYHATAET